LVLARVPAVFIDLADGNLDGGMVFGFDDAVGCGAFAGDVAGRRGLVEGMEGEGRRELTGQRARPYHSPCLRLYSEVLRVVVG